MAYVKTLITDGLNPSKPLFFDTETIGLYGRTRLVQVRQGDVAYEYDCFYVNIEEIKYFFKSWHLVIHNAHYDLSCLDFRRWLPSKLDDTLLMARCLYPELDSFSLESLSKIFNLGVKSDEGASDWSKYRLTPSQLEYATYDTLLVEKLYDLMDKSVCNTPYYKLDIASLLFSCEYEHKGMPVDLKAIRNFKIQLNKSIQSIDLPGNLNVNSPKLVREFLDTDNSSKAHLIGLKSEVSQKILDKRKYLKALSYIEDLSQHKCVYSIINPNGAKTGRFTSKSCDTMQGYYNLQQIPREMKSIFGDSGGIFVSADYPALEIWACGAVIADEFLVSVLINKEDLHYRAAELMFNKKREDISKFERQVAKMCNFTLMYGAGYNALAQAFTIGGYPEIAPKAQKFREDWLNTYKDINKAQQEAFNHFKTHNSKIVRTALGKPLCARSPTEALNFSIQGTGAECTKLALFLLQREGIVPVNTVHDSIALIASTEKEAEEYKQALKWSMEEAYRRVIRNCKANHLSLEVSVDVGDCYE